MSENERAVLSYIGNQELKWMEEVCVERFQRGNDRLARDTINQYNGTAYMLQALGLITAEELKSRIRAMFERYLAEVHPEEAE